ncbi:hypothetical protein [Tabrizicola oligotrophica]|uniref:Uncharacterized protein n=1 Tax=Tabrizicola oligotrophica TaxID=2710650 RepID=A0A6M0QWV2_9RHOB|nr:hypothetical protein [Tabrizicola oligotrophica]NEY91966.1 hypothetical protein [Tabrizicola oligotrophica]
MSDVDGRVSTQFSVSIASLLAVAPVIGFAFALSKEVAFYFFLGISPAQVLDVNDIIRISAIAVPPAAFTTLLAILVFNYGLLSPSPYQKNTTAGWIAYYLIGGLSLLNVMLFVLLGIAPEQAVTGFLVLSIVFFLKFFCINWFG